MSDSKLSVGLETSGAVGGIALLRGREILGERLLGETGRRHARTLVAELDELLREHSVRPRDVELVSVSIGPGSFTGLRVGVVAAKTWAFVTGCQLAAVGTFDAVIQPLPPEGGQVWVIDDALRGDLFVQRFSLIEGQWTAQTEVSIQAAEDWMAAIGAADRVCGPGVSKWEADLAERGISLAQGIEMRPTASGVAHRGIQLAEAGTLADSFELVPLYVRRSAAEEKMDADQTKAV